MATLSQHLYLPKRIAGVYFKILKGLKNLHQAASSIGFIGKCLFNHITPKFAVVSGQFINQDDKILVQQQIMATHMMQHVEKLKATLDLYHVLEEELISYSGPLFAKIILLRARNQLRRERVSSLSTKNSKIRSLIIHRVIRQERERKVTCIQNTREWQKSKITTKVRYLTLKISSQSLSSTSLQQLYQLMNKVY